jgi:hypothetical protein
MFTNSMNFLQKIHQSRDLEKPPRFAIHGSRGCEIHIRMFKLFLSCFVYSQIWLNWFMDDHHLGYITNLKRKTLDSQYHAV